jgi:hypothetical protein
MLPGDRQNHADTAVEHAVHLGLGNVAALLQPVEQLRPWPHLFPEHRAHALRQHARHVADQPAAGDVRQSLYRHGSHQLEHRLDVDAGRLHQRVGEAGIRLVLAEDAADQRVAVRMRAARGKPQQRVARHDGLAVDDALLFHHADAEARQVVLALRVHARHFRGLAADQRAAGLLAAFGDAADHLRRHAPVELAAGEIVEEKQRLGALHENVVHAHRHQVDADGVVAAEHEGELELGAHAIGAGNQDGLPVLLRDRAQRAETPEPGQHLGAHRALGERLDGFDQRVAGVDVHAGVTVREGSRHGR